MQNSSNTADPTTPNTRSIVLIGNECIIAHSSGWLLSSLCWQWSSTLRRTTWLSGPAKRRSRRSLRSRLDPSARIAARRPSSWGQDKMANSRSRSLSVGERVDLNALEPLEVKRFHLGRNCVAEFSGVSSNRGHEVGSTRSGFPKHAGGPADTPALPFLTRSADVSPQAIVRSGSPAS